MCGNSIRSGEGRVGYGSSSRNGRSLLRRKRAVKFVGYDSPELATLVSRTRSVAQWRVQSGGRVGMVIGEDAEEGGC